MMNRHYLIGQIKGVLYETARSYGEIMTPTGEEACWHLDLIHSLGRVLYLLERTPGGRIDGGSSRVIPERNETVLDRMQPGTLVKATAEMDTEEVKDVAQAR